MLQFLSLVLFALALSADGFGVGITYGLRKIKLPVLSIGIISFCSGFLFFVAMKIGAFISAFLSPVTARHLGAILLIVIGGWHLLHRQKGNEQEAAGIEEQKIIREFKIRSLGLVIQIMKTPQAADVDGSGTISAGESLALGAALSMDAFSAGIGAAFIGYSPWIMATTIALACGIFIMLGRMVGFRSAQIRWFHKISFLPGLILIFLGLYKWFS